MFQLRLAKKKMQLLVIWDLLAGQISCSAESSMNKVLPRGRLVKWTDSKFMILTWREEGVWLL